MGNPIWTSDAQELALRYLLNLSPSSAPPVLYVALFTTTADPTNGLTYELTDPTYARLAVTWDTTMNSTDLGVYFTCSSVGTFNLTNAGSFSGVRLMRTGAGSGTTYFWQDLDTQYDYDANAQVPVLPDGLRIGLTN